MKRCDMAKVLTETLEKLTKLEMSGALKDPKSSVELDIYGYHSTEHHSSNCVVATYVRQRTGLLVEVAHCDTGGFICVYEDVCGNVVVPVPRNLHSLIDGFDHGLRPWLVRN